MKPHASFLGQNKRFWAAVRTTSQSVGYSARGLSSVLAPSHSAIGAALSRTGKDQAEFIQEGGQFRTLVRTLSDYFEYRAQLLNDYVEPRLMI